MVGIGLLLIAVGLVASFLTKTEVVLAAPVDPGFKESTLFNIQSPTALAFTYDGRILATSQRGQLYVYKNNQLISTPALDLSQGNRVCYNSERGLLGLALDPSFATNRYIYTFYTFNQANYTPANNCPNSSSDIPQHPYNRVSRWVLGDDNKVVTTTEKILIDRLDSFCANHNGGDLKFGKDGLLYVSVGDSGCQITPPYSGQDGNGNSRRLDIPLGKILRVNPDGSIPASNPYNNAPDSRRCTDPAGPTSGTGPCKETYAWGLRNPFRFAFRPDSDEFYINDVGGGRWEEINKGRINADYGWNIREGYCNRGTNDQNCNFNPEAVVTSTPNVFRGPLYAYEHGTCNSITGGTFVPNGVWPAAYDGAYLFGDYVCNKVFRLTYNASNNTYGQLDFLTNVGIAYLGFGPYTVNGQQTQALFYANHSGGQVRVVYYDGTTNRSPTVDGIAANPTGGNIPLNVAFSAINPVDLDAGQTLTYTWTFGDTTPPVQTSGPTVNHTYQANGIFTATLQITDSAGGSSDIVKVKITAGNTPPQPVIISPTPDFKFHVGETITLNGTATDAENSSPLTLTWQVELLHNGPDTIPHTHPLLSPTDGNNVVFNAPQPEGFTGAEGSYLIVRLTATDPGGASSTITRALLPEKVNLTFTSTPVGARLWVNGSVITTGTPAAQVVSWVGYQFGVNITQTTQTISGTNAVFQNWSDGGATAHSITTPGEDAVYNANFSINGCNSLNVTSAGDSIASPTCGSLRYAVNNAGAGSKITFSGNASNGVTLAGNLTIGKAIVVEGLAGCGLSRFMISAANPAQITLTDGATIKGLFLSGLKLIATGTGNSVICSKVEA